MSKFTHLHVHTHYSLLDGLAKIDKLVEKAKDLGMTSLAITDHGVMYGVLEFYNICKKAGIKPIIGMETYIAPRRLVDKTPKIDTNPSHLILLAKDDIGYKNLLKLTSIAHLDGYYYKPRIDIDLLKTHHNGLIALSGCLQGEIPKLIIADKFQKAQERARMYQEIMGKGNFYLEIQSHPNLEEQHKANQGLIQISRRTGIPVVATCDVHYLDSADRDAHEVLLCVQTGKDINDKKRLSMASDDYSLKDPKVIIEHFKAIPHAIEHTQKIASECNLEIPMGKTILPKYEPPVGETCSQSLRRLANCGILWRFGKAVKNEDLNDEKVAQRLNKLPQEIRDRLEYELDVIESMGYESYFLIVQDFVNWAKNQGILVGPGRGSAAGSLVSYALNITNLNPLDYNLLFERFLNPERVSMPDIDLDFADDRRDEVIEYVSKKYGADHVAQIVTFGTMAARAAVRDSGRALGLSYADVDRIAKMMPFNMSLEQALQVVPELRKAYQEEEATKKMLDMAQKLEGVARHASMHAAGVVISDKPLTCYVPLQQATKGDQNIITQYSMGHLEELGLLKIDFLGLSNLTIIQNSLRIIQKTRNQEIDINNIPLDDKQTFKLLARAETTGVFQLESDGMKRYLRELQPNNINDIIVMVALYRPGPMDLIPEYIAGKHGKSLPKYLHPKLESILSETYGIAVYQEQIQEIAQQIAGFTLGEGYLLVKAVAKKIKKLLEEQREKFIKGAVKKGVSINVAQKLFSFIEPFARYGFNKSHSACYALISYQTAYLKAHFPAEFMAALLTSDQGNIDRVAIEVAESKRMGIEILPPDVNESFAIFTVIDPKKIRFGLAAVKNVGEGPIQAIIEARQKGGKFKDISDFAQRVDIAELNKKVLESLAKSGALDSFGERDQLLIGVEQILKYGREQQKNRLGGQQDLFGNIDQALATANLSLPKVDPVPDNQKLAWEKEFLGIYVSKHPLTRFVDFLQNNTLSIANLNSAHEGKRVKIGGIITKIKKIITRSGEPMIFAQIDDMISKIEILVFPKILALNPEIWQEDNVVMVDGKISNKDNEIKVLADNTIELNDEVVKKYANLQQFEISIPKGGSKSLLATLKEILEAHPGILPVILYIPNDGEMKKVETKLKVDGSSELVKQIENILGIKSVKLKSS